MAPITRSGAGALVPQAEGLRPPRERYRETSWQFIPQDARSERELSVGQTSSFDEDADMMADDEGEEGERRFRLEGPDDHEDILHPLRETANRVGREVERFAEVLDGYNPLRAKEDGEKYDMTVDLIEQYHGIARKTVDRLRHEHGVEKSPNSPDRPWRNKMRGISSSQETEEVNSDDDGSSSFPEHQTTLQDLERWEQEAQTWDLLARIVELRHPAPGSETAKAKTLSKYRQINQYSTGSAVWEGFLETDELALERKVILEWLKDSAIETGENINALVKNLRTNADRGDELTHGWLYTKAAIKNTKRLIGVNQTLDPTAPDVIRLHKNTSKTESLISQLDPDAMSRQGQKLQAEDQYFERAVWLGCYEMLRRGYSPNDIREWCMDRTEIWRAVSMSGLPGEYEGDSEPADPSSWTLWRRMCFSLARNGGDDDYERAVYGILSGDIPSVEPICRSWDDFVFAHYNALLRTQFDSYIEKTIPRSLTLSDFGVFDAVQFHGEPRSAAHRLIQTLESNPKTKQEALQPMKMLQGILIANRFGPFIYQQGLALAKRANEAGPSNLIPAETVVPDNIEKYISLDDYDSLRVIAHVLLIFSGLGVELGPAFQRNTIENVIVCYVSFLRLSGKEELIPLYCSLLSGPRRYAVLSRSLIDVTDDDQRSTQIKLIRQLGLNVQRFVQEQSEHLLLDYQDTSTSSYPAAESFKLFIETSGSGGPRKRIKPDFFGDEDVERVDLLLIRSFEWYLLVDGLWSETFKMGTYLYLRFLKHMHLGAAKLLAIHIPCSAIAWSKTKAIIGGNFDLAGLERDGDEDLTVEIDSDGSAERKMLLRKHMLSEAKNCRELEALVLALDKMETVRCLEQIMLEKSGDYQKQTEIKSSIAGELMDCRQTVPILLKGWLLTYPSESLRGEFTLLREAYLPDTILAWISTLEFVGHALTRDFLMECMDLAAMIAEEDSDLLQLFKETGKMQDLVQAFAQASKSLLVLTSAKKSAVSRSKKLRFKGWSHELWSAKQG